jgi:hypothetical protein
MRIDFNYFKLIQWLFYYILETSEIFFRREKEGAERDDFDFLIFFCKKKSKNQNHLSQPPLFRGEKRSPKFPVYNKRAIELV